MNSQALRQLQYWLISAFSLLTACSVQTNPPDYEITPSHGEILLDSDFTSGWKIDENEAYQLTYTNDGYRIALQSKVPYALWLASGHIQEEYFYSQITVEAEVCPPDGGAYGIAFHQQDNSLHAFIVTCDNRFILLEQTDSLKSTVLEEGMLPENLASAASQEHKLAINSASENLTLHFDGYLLDTVTSLNSPPGDIGPYVRMEQSPISVVVQQLLVYEAEDPEEEH